MDFTLVSCVPVSDGYLVNVQFLDNSGFRSFVIPSKFVPKDYPQFIGQVIDIQFDGDLVVSSHF